MDSREMLKRVARRQQCLFDDGLFAASAYSRPEIIDDIVSRVFCKAGIAVRRIVRTEVQKRMVSGGYKEIVFDCYAESGDGSRMAVEVQNDAGGFSHMREGFYLSRLRIEEEKGTGYDEMKGVYLIILHRHNPYRKEGVDMPIYEKRCYIKGTGISYADGLNVLRVNGDYMERGDVLGDLMIAMKAEKPEDAGLELYESTLKDMKERYDMEYTLENLLRLGRQEGIAEGKASGIIEGKIEGKAEGRIEGKNEMADDLRKLGVPEDIIRKAIQGDRQ